jgi:hypothetical protein
MKLAIFTIICGIVFQQLSCGYPETPMVKLKGPEDRNDLVFFYKKDTSYEQKELFQNTVIHKPHPEGKGYYLQDGVIDLLSIRNSDFEGYAINFSKDATPEQRERLKKAIESSPIIYKVYENVVPNEIKLE